jgi:hypothetical protein
MRPTLAAKSARVCDRTVTKGLPSFHAVAPNPDRELADARAAIDRGDERAALKRLERARRGYAARHDVSGLEHLFILADVLEAGDERTRIGRTNLVYAIQQNLRLESRRRAHTTGEPFHDPYPDLAAPTEHTGIAIGRGVKLAIAVATAIGTAVIVGIVVAVAFFGSNGETKINLRLVNDTGREVQVRGCDDATCDTSWMHADLDPGLATERRVAVDDLVDVFELKARAAGKRCLPLRVHDAYVQGGSDAGLVLVAKLSAATPCPGVTVLPSAVSETGL